MRAFCDKALWRGENGPEHVEIEDRKKVTCHACRLYIDRNIERPRSKQQPYMGLATRRKKKRK